MNEEKLGHRIKRIIGYTYKEWFEEFSKVEAEIFFPTIATRKDYDIKVAVTIEEIDPDK